MCITKLLYNSTTFSTAEIRIKNRKLRVFLADTPTRMMVGLMHRTKVGADGMLFTPEREARHGIWMLNMKFPIDILWLDGSGRVVDVMERAKPCRSFFSCPTYKPSANSMYILELPAGKAARLGLRKGSRVGIGSINKR